MATEYLVGFGAGVLVCGALLAILRLLLLRHRAEERRRQADAIVEFARQQARVIEESAQATAKRLETEAEAYRVKAESRIEAEERALAHRRETLEAEAGKLREREDELNHRLAEVRKAEQAHRTKAASLEERLREVGELTREQARALIVQEAESRAGDEVENLRQQIIQRKKEEFEREAKGTLIACMQRIALNPPNHTSAAVVPISSDEMKGRIIGREGRNIRHFENLTGVTLMIDETPDSVLVSSFDPVRREVARLALARLIEDGRIQPASIEAAVSEAERETEANIIEHGQDAVQSLGLRGVHPEIVHVVGKLYYRLANNQNCLAHSVEVAHLSALLAAELGLNTQLAKRAGLFHDMGKALSHEWPGSHAKVGAELLRRYDEADEVVNAVAAHHEEVSATSPYAGLLMVADAVSATRPGARSDTMEGYLQRVQALERICKKQDGVREAYALQAGREVRVIVEPGLIHDEEAQKLALRLRRQIEADLHYPDTIKITVIREQRFSETAK